MKNMKMVVALEDLKINAIYREEGLDKPFLKKLTIIKGSVFSIEENPVKGGPRYLIKGAVNGRIYKTNEIGKIMEVNLLHSI